MTREADTAAPKADNSERSANVRARIQEIIHLPPLAPVAQELLQELTREEIEIPNLAQVIEKDPALTARIIGIANSAYFSQRDPIYDVTTAIIRVLGLNLVKSLSLGIALSSPFDSSNCPPFDLDRYWYIAMQTATLANQLAPQAALEPGAGEYLFLGGLLHNIGELVLVHTFHEKMTEVLIRSRTSDEASQDELEVALIGLHSPDAGVALGHKWHLPAKVVSVIGNHKDKHYRDDDWRAVCLVGYCSQLIATNYRDPTTPPDEATIARHNVLQLPENAVLAAMERLQSKSEQTMELAKMLAAGETG